MLADTCLAICDDRFRIKGATGRGNLGSDLRQRLW